MVAAGRLTSILLLVTASSAFAAEASTPAWKKLPRSQGPAPKTVCMNSGATAADYAGASAQLDPEQAKAAGLRFWTGSVVQMADTLNGGQPLPPGTVLTGAPTDAVTTASGGDATCSGYLADWASVEAKRKADLAAARKQELSKANRTRQLVVSPNLDQLLKLTVRTEP